MLRFTSGNININEAPVWENCIFLFFKITLAISSASLQNYLIKLLT